MVVLATGFKNTYNELTRRNTWMTLITIQHEDPVLVMTWLSSFFETTARPVHSFKFRLFRVQLTVLSPALGKLRTHAHFSLGRIRLRTSHCRMVSKLVSSPQSSECKVSATGRLHRQWWQPAVCGSVARAVPRRRQQNTVDLRLQHKLWTKPYSPCQKSMRQWSEY